MPRLGVTKKKKSPHATELSQLKKQVQRLTEQIESRDREQAATSDILRVIASSPTEIQPVLSVVAESAARLCDATDAMIGRFDGSALWLVAHYGSIPRANALGEQVIFSRGVVHGRAIIDRQTIHVHDIAAEVETEFPDAKALHERTGTRTIVASPLLREGVPVGVIVIRRTEVRPFTDKQIALLKTFADQAVIAIENVRLFQELKESLEQQTATSDVLRVIAGSPTELQPVLDAVTESAVKLAGAKQGHIRQYDGEFLRLVASYGESPEEIAVFQTPVRPSIESRSGRAFLERKPIHDVDAQVERHPMAAQTGARTALAVPLLREDTPIGVFTIWRDVVEPFNERQIDLVKTFADQAVVAIENVRLFKEIQERNAELHEALEHQTATSEVLGIISRSPTDVQPVLDAIVESAAKVCGIDDVVLRLHQGNSAVPRAHFGPIPIGRGEISIDEPRYRWIREHGTLHIPDRREQNIIPTVGSVSEWRTWLGVPLRQHGEFIGTLHARRIEVRPFTPVQIKLLETFANQAVIALENVRLFNELQARNCDLTEALEQQTATSKILEVIAGSPTDFQPVLRAIAESATRLCEATDAHMSHVDGDVLRLNADTDDASLQREVPITRDRIAGQAILDRRTIHIHDLAAEPEEKYEVHRWRSLGFRTVLMAPLLREGTAIGTLALRRNEARPFTEKQIALLETFANQAVIAIENTRLFKEIQERNAELREALEHQTATSEVLGIISRSPTDVQPVLDAIVESAAKVCGIDDVVLRLRDGDIMIARAHFGPVSHVRVKISSDDPRHRWMHTHGPLAHPRRTRTT
jgi:GAF domain-containing protein